MSKYFLKILFFTLMFLYFFNSEAQTKSSYNKGDIYSYWGWNFSWYSKSDIYHEGDFLVRQPGDVHRPSATLDQACICLSVLSAPIKLTGLKRVLNPFMRFNPS